MILLYFLLFLILSLLFFVESSTSYVRVAGVYRGSLGAALTLQSGLSLLSRVLMTMFMPMLGFMADNGYLNVPFLIEYVSYFIITISLILVPLLKRYIVSIYISMIDGLNSHGRYIIPELVEWTQPRKSFKTRNLDRIVYLSIIAYVPYYLAWPVTIQLLSEYQEYRAMIIGTSSILNGLNTIFLVLWVDPFLVRLARYRLLSFNMYDVMVRGRILASLLSVFILGLVDAIL